MDDNFATKCRLCFEDNATFHLFSDKELICLIFQYFKIKVEDNDKFPKHICNNCKKQIESFNKYTKKIKLVDKNLRILIKIQEEKNETEGIAFLNNVKNDSDGDDFDSTLPPENDDLNLKNNDKFKCTKPDCPKSYKTLYSLRTHVLKHEGKRQFLCVTCGKDFLSKNSLTCHEKIHALQKGYVCKICNIEFSVRSNLRTHEKKYHEGFKFYCSKCTKSFLNKCSLERHEKTHIGIKEFKCENCTAEFYTNKELVKHRKYHKGTRQFKCEECFKMFFEKHHLLIHHRIHTGEKPYVCDFPGCQKSFTESQKLKKHQKTKHIST